MLLCKDKNFKANHNTRNPPNRCFHDVCYYAKIRILKQITTLLHSGSSLTWCLLLCKDKNFKANHNNNVLPFQYVCTMHAECIDSIFFQYLTDGFLLILPIWTCNVRHGYFINVIFVRRSVCIYRARQNSYISLNITHNRFRLFIVVT